VELAQLGQARKVSVTKDDTIILHGSGARLAVWLRAVVWRVVVWCVVVWRGVVWCGVAWCGVVWCGVVQCSAVQCSAVQCLPGAPLLRVALGLGLGLGASLGRCISSPAPLLVLLPLRLLTTPPQQAALPWQPC
jgi:hypothetical protein